MGGLTVKAREIVALTTAVLHEYARRTYGPERDYEREPCDRCAWAQMKQQRGCADWDCSCDCHSTEDGA